MPTNNFKVGEMLNKRTKNTKTWINFDGSYTTEIHSGIVHFDDGLNNLHNINTDLLDEADADLYEGSVSKHGKEMLKHEREKVKAEKKLSKLNRDKFDFQVPTLPFSCQIPKNIKKGYSIGQDGEFIRFIPQGASPSKGYVDKEEKNKIQYQDAWNDADVILEVISTGVKETIILKTDRAPSSFTFEVIGDITDELTAGALKLSPAWLEDANGEKRDVSQVVRREGEQTYIDLLADVTGLVYPIEIDPTVTIQPDATAGKDSYIISTGAGSNYGDSGSVVIGRNASVVHRSLFYFNLSSIPVASIVTSSTFSIVSTGSGSSSNGYLYDLHLITSAWDEMTVTWGTQPQFDSISDVSVTLSSITDTTVNNISLNGIVKRWIEQGVINNGFIVKASDEANFTTSNKNYYSSDYSTVTTRRPKLTVIYNRPPTAPTVTAPNGGETWNSSHSITWNPATDADGNALQYQIQLTTDGTNWSDIVALTTAGATQYVYDFINKPQTSLAKIRIRAYDGSAHGPWDESNGVFSIIHNVAPTAPTNLTPVTTKDRAGIIRFAWQHNDLNADAQSKFDLDYRLQGSTTWNNVTQNTINQYYDLPANALPKGTIEWRVRTYDQSDLSGPYSELKTFLAGDKPPTPTTLNPIDGSIVSVSNPTVEWSSVGQIGYNLKVLDLTETTTLWETDQTSNNKAHTVGYSLENETDYVIQLTIKNSDGLSSDIEKSQIHVSYTPPAVPIITTSIGSTKSSIILDIENPVPAGTEPAVSYNDVYKIVNGVFVRIVESISQNGQYEDFAIASGIQQQYYVRAYGENETYSDSVSVFNSITLEGVWLHDITSAESTIFNCMRDSGGRSSNWKPDVKFTKYAGRSKPVSDFTEFEERDISVELKLMSEAEKNALEKIVKSKNIVCYRDGRGRLLFGNILAFPLDDQTFGYEVEIEIIEIDYTEVV